MATIYCFSGTGNSLYAAKEIAREIDATLISMSDDIVECHDDVIGFVFPVYFWNLPNRVEQVMKHINITNKHAYIFSIISCGGFAHGVSGQINTILKKNDLRLSYYKDIKEVDNYIIVYNPKDTKKTHELAQVKIDEAIVDIKNRVYKKPKRYSLFNRISKSLNPNNKASIDKNFMISDTCTGCSSCERICPVNNIKMKDNIPSFQGKCESCLACLHTCPVNALNYKTKTVNKKRYRHPNIAKKELEALSSYGLYANSKK